MTFNRNIPLSINASLSERLKYAPDTVDLDDVANTLERYEALLEVVNDSDLNTTIELDDDLQDVAKDIKQALNVMTRQAVESMVDNPYKDFFDDCVGALNAHWPCAEVTDQTLRSVILDAIAKGDNDDA